MELTYTKCGDYYIPDLAAPELPKIGKYGRMRHRFLRDYHMRVLQRTSSLGQIER